MSMSERGLRLKFGVWKMPRNPDVGSFRLGDSGG